MAHVDPGELQYAISIVVPARKVDANGHYVTTESLISTRAAVRAVKSQDVTENGAARMQESLQFILRWRKGLTTDCAVEWEGKRYEIDYIDPVPWAGNYMRIKAVSYDAGVGGQA